MSVQVIEDAKGKATGVFIPISEWKKLKRQYRGLAELETDEPSKEQILSELREAVVQLKLVQEGKMKARPAQELLDEL
jgi:heme oxygenase